MARLSTSKPGDIFSAVNEWDLGDVGAIQALARGECEAHQQRNAMKFIIEILCATYDLSFRPGGSDAARATDFMEGRRFVGLQIVKLLKLNLSKLKKERDNA